MFHLGGSGLSRKGSEDGCRAGQKAMAVLQAGQRSGATWWTGTRMEGKTLSYHFPVQSLSHRAVVSCSESFSQGLARLEDSVC
jgi:hypothetical protein